MQSFAEKFYKSKPWQRSSGDYKASVNGLCESCKRKGLIVPGEIVHHKIKLTPQNIDDPAVTLAWSNLELLCRKCHAKAHGSTKRYRVDSFGRVLF